jgi:hypothetical protein
MEDDNWFAFKSGVSRVATILTNNAVPQEIIPPRAQMRIQILELEQSIIATADAQASGISAQAFGPSAGASVINRRTALGTQQVSTGTERTAATLPPQDRYRGGMQGAIGDGFYITPTLSVTTDLIVNVLYRLIP